MQLSLPNLSDISGQFLDRLEAITIRLDVVITQLERIAEDLETKDESQQ